MIFAPLVPLADCFIFLAVLSLGVGLDNVLAGWWSTRRVDVGIGMVIIASLCLPRGDKRFGWANWLAFLPKAR